MTVKILIVEDEESYRTPLMYQLTREGYDVTAAETGEEAWDYFLGEEFDFVLLDVMLPGIDGIALCRKMRQQSNVPIVMVTAKSTEIDTIVGLEIGADDYVTKPYSFRELLARIRAVLRRNQERNSSNTTMEITIGNIVIDRASHAVTMHGKPVNLALKEYQLLECLARNKGHLMARNKLIHHVWGADYVGDTKTLDVHIKRLREKLEEDSRNPKHIVTVRGIGYKIDD